MAQENLICIYQCLERAASTPSAPAEHLLGPEAVGPTQDYYILFALSPRGLLDRGILEEAMEDLLASRQNSEAVKPAASTKYGSESLRLGPFSGLSGVESMAQSLAERVNSGAVAILGAHEYNAVIESTVSWDGEQGAFFQTLFNAAHVLEESQERKSKKGLLGKIFN